MKTGALMRVLLFSGALLILAAAPAAALSDAPYISPGDYDVIHVLAPPPAPGSEAARRDLEAVLETQRTSSPERMRLAETDATADISAFAGVLGVDPAKLPRVAAFLRKVARDTQFATTIGKDCWERPRPFVLDSRILPPGKMQQLGASRAGDAKLEPHAASRPWPPLAP